MIRLTFLLSCLLSVPLLGEPRFYSPSSLQPGSINEVYAWDEAAIGPFSVEVWRPGSEKPVTSAKGFAVDHPLTILGKQDQPLHWSAALVCPDALDASGPVTVRFVGTDKKTLAEVSSEILVRDFPVEEIHLNRAMTQLRVKPDVRKDREAATIWTAYDRFDPNFPWSEGKFILPVPAEVPHSAEFGDTRLFLYSDGTCSRDFHHGTDFAVPVGTAVSAAAPGTVVLVASRMLTGKTVVLEHAPGLYSDYFHLSKPLVRLGQKVAAGERIALSGSSGLATGPHLHWEVRSEGISVDALDLVAKGLLDKERVSAVISSIERSTH